MKNLLQLLDCYLLKILPQGFTLNGIKANCKAKQKKKKTQNLKVKYLYWKKGGKKIWGNVAF